MTVYLACFSNLPTHAGPGPVLAISNGLPRGMTLERLWPLVPEWDDVEAGKKGDLEWREFVRRYLVKLDRECLEQRDGEWVVDRGVHAHLRVEPTLCCFERPGAQCHRRALAAWLLRHGYDVVLDGVKVDSTFRIGG